MKAGFPGYRVRQQIYESANSLVYRALREQDKQPVILKVLKPDYSSPDELDHYNQEYEILQRLNASQVVKAYGLEPYHGTLVLVLEDFGGLSLSRWLEERAHTEGGVVPLSQSLDLAVKLAAALEQIHTSGVFHKNLTPSNVVFNPPTEELKLIDFGLATTLSRVTLPPNNPQGMEGTLAYVSPEQTGRMNRAVDYRTDFYSLGIMLYELLTGRLPFESTDPLELVHAHLAKSPAAPGALNPAVPPVVSELVLKLMAKVPEDRYQSARGLKHDLVTCWQQLQMYGQIDHFELGTQDRSDHFLISEKLYGRETEIETLITAFERASQGSAELLLIAGSSGIGKTALINEVHRPIVRHRGYFIKGKFDQFGRNIPFSAFVQAFRDLMRQFLSEGKAQRDVWRSRLLSALGDSGQILCEVIPELERVIGPQPPVPELSGNAAQNRFNLLMRNFVSTFTTAGHPLVIFFDDLQWADLASLKLMQLLLREKNTGYLLLLGAYRDKEVTPAHPLLLTLDELNEAGAAVNTIRLAPLKQSDLNQLVATTLACSPERATPLTQSIHQKTGGNPFFSIQVLKTFHEQGLITFNAEDGCWQYDIRQIRALALTQDVVEFMARQLRKLLPATQEVLKLAACIGVQFDLDTLALVYQHPLTQTAADLWQAVQQEIVLPQSGVYQFIGARTGETDSSSPAHTRAYSTYRFLHDRAQQAAYSLIPEEQRPAIHLGIGRLLLNKTSEPTLEEWLFEIVSHSNAGLSQITDPAERYALVSLNLRAGQKAKDSTAYTAAMSYLTVGLTLLLPDCWETHYALTLALHHEFAEVAYLTGDFEQMEQRIRQILQQATSLPDKVKGYEIQILADVARYQLKSALRLGLDVLEQLGITFPKQIGQAEIVSAFQEVQTALAGKSVAELLDLPVMTDPGILAAMRIILSLGAVCYLAAPELYPLLIARQLILSIRYGNTATSIYAYASYGMLLCGILEAIDGGHEFGQLALKLLLRLKAKELQAKTYFTFYTFIYHWKAPIAETVVPLLEGYHSGVETGDLEFASYSVTHHLTNAYFSGRELNGLAEEIAVFRAAIHSFHQESPYNYSGTCQQAVLNLLGKSQDPCILAGEAYDETRMLPLYEQMSEITALHNLFIHKMILCCLFGEYEQAVEHANRSEPYLAGVPGIIAVVLHRFYDSLARLSLYDRSDTVTQTAILQKVADNQEKLRRWAAGAPMNYQHKFALVEAERCRVLAEPLAAMDWYDRAITGAKENGYTQEEALANELAARFYLGLEKGKIAQVYLQDAYLGYRKWGAAAKTADLVRLYPGLLAPFPISQRHEQGAPSITTDEPLDLITVVKASQAIAGEIEPDRLIGRMIRIALENAGAQRGVLLLEKEGAWEVEAIGIVECNDIQVLQARDVKEWDTVPVTLIEYVARTRQNVVLDDASIAPAFAHDSYIRQNAVKSVLCVQLVNRGRLSGILYLENNLTPKAFTVQRLELLSLLTAQMAISLDNAYLYSTLEATVAERTRQLEATNKELESFAYSVSHDLRAPLRSIDGFSQAVLEDYGNLLDAEGQSYLRRVRSASRRMGQLIDDLLKLSRITRQEMRQEVVNLSAVANDIVTDLMQTDTGRSVEFVIAEGVVGTGDPNLLRVVLSNLLSNAWKFTQKREQAVIQFYQTIHDGERIYVVKDNGAGFDIRYANKMFGAFQRLHQQKDFEGTGIGLATVQRIVHRHGGRIWAEGAVDEGATFYFTLG